MAPAHTDPVIRELATTPGVGSSNEIAGTDQDRCLPYVFRCAVYYAETEGRRLDPEKLKWWNWKDSNLPGRTG